MTIFLIIMLASVAFWSITQNVLLRKEFNTQISQLRYDLEKQIHPPEYKLGQNINGRIVINMELSKYINAVTFDLEYYWSYEVIDLGTGVKSKIRYEKND